MKIKVKRIEMGIKQKDLAKRIGITAQYLMKIEHGEAKNPSIDIMKRISEELGESVEELFFSE